MSPYYFKFQAGISLSLIHISHFPKIELKEDEKSGSKDSYLALFKQKTAYEIYRCDWSSDVCSSDLVNG